MFPKNRQQVWDRDHFKGDSVVYQLNTVERATEKMSIERQDGKRRRKWKRRWKRKKIHTPARTARRQESNPERELRIKTFASGCLAHSLFVTVIPSIFGILIFIQTTSGTSSSYRSRASNPSAASPATSISSSNDNNFLMFSLVSFISSTKSNLTFDGSGYTFKTSRPLRTR